MRRFRFENVCSCTVGLTISFRMAMEVKVSIYKSSHIKVILFDTTIICHIAVTKTILLHPTTTVCSHVLICIPAYHSGLSGKAHQITVLRRGVKLLREFIKIEAITGTCAATFRASSTSARRRVRWGCTTSTSSARCSETTSTTALIAATNHTRSR